MHFECVVGFQKKKKASGDGFLMMKDENCDAGKHLNDHSMSEAVPQLTRQNDSQKSIRSESDKLIFMQWTTLGSFYCDHVLLGNKQSSNRCRIVVFLGVSQQCDQLHKYKYTHTHTHLSMPTKLNKNKIRNWLRVLPSGLDWREGVNTRHSQRV